MCVCMHVYVSQSQPQLPPSPPLPCFARPSHNIDCNRNCCTFEEPVDVLSFIESMKKHPMFGGHPVRTQAIICLVKLLQTPLVLISATHTTLIRRLGFKNSRHSAIIPSVCFLPSFLSLSILLSTK